MILFENEFDNLKVAEILYQELCDGKYKTISNDQDKIILVSTSNNLNTKYYITLRVKNKTIHNDIHLPSSINGAYSKDYAKMLVDESEVNTPSILINIDNVDLDLMDMIKNNKSTFIHELTHMVQDVYVQDFSRKRYNTKSYTEFSRDTFVKKLNHYIKMHRHAMISLSKLKKNPINDDSNKVAAIIYDAFTKTNIEPVDFIEYIVNNKRYISDIDEIYAHANSVVARFVELGYTKIQSLYNIPAFTKIYLFTDNDVYKSLIKFIWKSITNINEYTKHTNINSNTAQALIEGYDAIFESTYKLAGFKAPVKTDIEPEDRTLKNLPRYSTGKSKINFRDWLLIKKPSKFKSLKNFDYSWGMGENGKFYGWSHRAVGEFYPGKTVNPDICGNIKPGKKWKIKSETEAAKQAISFARSVS